MHGEAEDLRTQTRQKINQPQANPNWQGKTPRFPEVFVERRNQILQTLRDIPPKETTYEIDPKLFSILLELATISELENATSKCQQTEQDELIQDRFTEISNALKLLNKKL